MDNLNLLADLIARARAAGADAADAVLIAGHLARRAAPAGQDRACRARRGPRPRPARLRRQARRHRRRPPRSTRRVSPPWPSARWRWPRWCRRTPMPGWPRPPRRRQDAALDLDDPSRARHRRPAGARRAGRGCRAWRCRASPIRKAPTPATGAPRRCLVTSRRVRRAGGAHQPLGLGARRWPAPAPACSATTTITRRVHLADLDDPAAIGRSAGRTRGRAAATRPGRTPRSCRWSTIRACPAGCWGISPAPSTAPRWRAARQLPEGQDGRRDLRPRHRHRTTTRAGVRGLRSRSVRRRGRRRPPQAR